MQLVRLMRDLRHLLSSHLFMSGNKLARFIVSNSAKHAKAITCYCFARDAEASDSKPAVSSSPGVDWSPDQPTWERKLVPERLTRIDPGSNPRNSPFHRLSAVSQTTLTYSLPGIQNVAVKRPCYQQLDRIRNSIRYDTYDVFWLLRRNRPCRGKGAGDLGTRCPKRSNASLRAGTRHHVPSRRWP